MKQGAEGPSANSYEDLPFEHRGPVTLPAFMAWLGCGRRSEGREGRGA